MVRGPKKHMKRLSCPSHWMLDKLGGVFAPKPSAGPHKQRECLPLALILRNRLKYALTYKEVMSIVMQRLIKVDGKIKMDKCYPVGFQDVVEIEKTDEHFRLIYDPKGRFVVHRITAEEAAYKLCRVKEIKRSAKNVPVAITHDGRTIRYPDPLVKRDDTVMVDIETGKIKDFVKFETGNMIMVCGGRNRGRVGILVHQEKHKGSHTICHVKDSAGNQFATRSTNIFTIGKGNKPLISLPKGKGIKLTILQEQAKAYKTAA